MGIGKDGVAARAGGTPPPSVKRRNWRGWLALAATEGVAAGAITLAALWRDWPGLPAPAGSLSEHAVSWAEIAARKAASAVELDLFASQARLYAEHWRSIGLAGRFAIEWRVTVSMLAACAPAALTARRALKPHDALVLLRGPSRYEGKAAARELRKRFREAARRRPDHPIGPDIPWSAEMWTRHTLLVGGTGAGKSTFIKPLIKRVVAAGEPMLLFDPKGDFTAAFDGPALLAPWDDRSLVWDIARDVRNIIDMRRLAASMIQTSSDPMWSSAARSLLVGLLVCLQGTKNIDWGWKGLAELVSLPQPDLLAIMRRWHPEAIRAVERASVTTQGILINLAAFCSPIIDLAQAWGDVPASRRVSFRDWAIGDERPHPQIILQGNGAYSELTRSYVEAIVGVVSATVNSVELDDDPERKLWFIADEFAKMGKLPVRDLFEVGRSRGVRCVVACQDFAQLEELYGEAFVRALMSMCATHVIGQMSPGQTTERICRTLGSREHERMNVSTSIDGTRKSQTSSFSRENIPLYSPSELASRLGPTEDGSGVKLLVSVGGDAYELFYPSVRLKRRRPAHIPAAWTLGVRRAGAATANPAGMSNNSGQLATTGATGLAPSPAVPGGKASSVAASEPQTTSDGNDGIDPFVASLLASELPQEAVNGGDGIREEEEKPPPL
ncbi:type IV secretion system DNA-binding domain-containing protein [Burkholderia thailandensis]|uniref:type IV secretion system DNA-binding domain-containing protein n=1 Tax=Burkholderia thailandensis TaxID=57975 RepID=UPI00217F1DAD|nr:type IV secretion system DNA-binding domain-containing protein [Burkholderia thailandensis]MCS6473781.1 type IV secretion system DNA-binding domain-containing protein [Burkholderia thailandensis]